jgi:hypothetical protein
MKIFVGTEKDLSLQLERVALSLVGPSSSDEVKKGAMGGKTFRPQPWRVYIPHEGR